jgi:hypothetical protein
MSDARKMTDAEVERLLHQQRQQTQFPPTPDIASSVRQRIATPATHASRSRVRQFAQMAGAVVAFALVAVVFVAVFRPANSIPTDTRQNNAPAVSRCTPTASSQSQPTQVAGDPTHTRWYEHEGLWASPASLSGINPSLSDGPGIWYAGTWPVLWAWTGSGNLAISGHSLDPASTPLQAQSTLVPDGSGATSTLTFDHSGCWQVTGRINGQRLDLVVDVLPFDQRPDVVAAQAQQAAARPYPIPMSCAADRWTIDDRLAQLAARYWLDGDGVAASMITPALLWQGPDNRIEWSADQSTDFSLGASLADNPDAAVGVDRSQVVSPSGSRWVTRISFPDPGCWTLHAVAGNATLDITVYVYPQACRRDPGQPLPAACREPAS